ncbi:LysR family transcriptional regulator [Sphingomonas sp. Marseille-Q8236]
MDPDIALFVDVVREGSLAAAARVWRLSPAMVSKRIARLEERFGVRLLHRTTRRLATTPIGAAFHAEVAPLVANLRAAQSRMMQAAAEPSGPLRISAPTSFGRLWIAPYLPTFLRRYPAVQLQIDLADNFDDLIGGRIDVAFRITATPPGGVAAHRLMANRRILCASPRYLAEAGRPESLEDLAGHRLLAASGQLPWHLAGVTVPGRSWIETNSSEVVRELVMAGAGIALRSLWDVADTLADGRLVRVLPEHEGAQSVALWALHAQAGAPAAVAALIDHLIAIWRAAPWAT